MVRNSCRSKIIPDKTRHRCLRELFSKQLQETPLVFNFPATEDDLVDGATSNWLRLQSRIPKDLREAWDPSTAFQQRIAVNYLRHCASNYDALRRLFKSKPVGQQAQVELHRMLKAEALDVIGKQYPDLREQCKQQKDTPDPPIKRRRSRR